MKNYNYEEIMNLLDEMMDIMNADYSQEQWSKKDEVDAVRTAKVKELYLTVKDIAENGAFDFGGASEEESEELWYIMADKTEEVTRKAEIYLEGEEL